MEDADRSAAEIAKCLSTSAKPVAAVSVRKTREPARAKYADLLIDEVAAATETDSADQIRAELEHLNLLRYCQSALAARSNREAG